MKERLKKYGLFFIFIFLLFLTIFIFYIDWKSSQKKLIFGTLDVGQGDALFIQSPTGTQILIDGGPPRKILGKLSRIMPPLDRSIDALIITNPDADHIGGFLDILKNYKVDYVFESGTLNDSKIYQNLKEEIKNKNISNILAKKGMRIHIGGGAVIDILFPDRDVSSWTTNDGSLVALLSYGDTKIVLTGDATIETEKIILQEQLPEFLHSDILKVGHHGSRTSTSEDFIKTILPSYAIISNGNNNKYGHPHKEVIDLLSSYNIKILRTDLLGTIIMQSDGIKEDFSFIK